MVLVKFPKTQGYGQVSDTLSKQNCPITYLQGKCGGIENFVHIVPDSIKYQLDQDNISYIVLREDELSKHLSLKGFRYFLQLKGARPEFANGAEPDPGKRSITFHVDPENITDASDILTKLGYDPLPVPKQKVVGWERSILGASPKAAFEVDVRTEHVDDIIKRLAKKNLCGYDKRSRVLISATYTK